ncbi:hypothetical protein NM688_g4981 [Phlebia brevispora]|uniref:Uncharacterized protein n=1 Tax=Phlebia brevispora TaxID=194682 RepID=A0ACC1T140_9APHY|nr:hypothetical protein NM688_g4981 [Phlebia brevispora]
MSDPSSIPDIVAVYRANLTDSYCAFATLAVVCYEFIITIQYEYEFVLRHKFTASTWLFVLNRYATLAGIVSLVAPISAQVHIHPPLSKNDTTEALLSGFILYLPSFILAAFSALRVFALLGRAYILAGSLILLSLFSMVIILYQASHATSYYVQCSSGEFALLRFDLAYVELFTRRLSLATSLANIAPDIVALVATWLKTHRHIRQIASIGKNAGLGATLLRYGFVYFVLNFVMNLMGFLLYLIPSARINNPMGNFTAILPNVMLARFLINLQQVDSAAESRNRSRSSRFPTSLNSRLSSLPGIIGNLGEPLADGEQFIDEDGEERESCEQHSKEMSNLGVNEGMSGTAHVGGGQVETPLAYAPLTYVPTFLHADAQVRDAYGRFAAVKLARNPPSRLLLIPPLIPLVYSDCPYAARQVQQLSQRETPAGGIPARCGRAGVEGEPTGEEVSAGPAQAGSKILLSRLPTDVGQEEVEVRVLLNIAVRRTQLDQPRTREQALFAKTVGPVKDSFIVYNSQGNSKGMAIVTFQRREDAMAARKKYNGKIIDGRRPIKIEIVKDEDDASKPPPAAPPSLLQRIGLAVGPAAVAAPSNGAVPPAPTTKKAQPVRVPASKPLKPRKQKKGPKRLKKVSLTVAQLDAEMEEYRAHA